MKTKIIILSIIVAASNLYSQDSNSSYVPTIAKSPAPPDMLMSAPALPSNPQDTQRIKQLEQQLADAQADNQQLQNMADQYYQELVNVYDVLNDYRRQLHVPMLNGWIYHETQGWIYTDSENFPYLYKAASQTWYYFARDVEGVRDGRAFFNYTTNEWEIWE